MHTFEGMVIANTGRSILFQSHYWHAGIWLPLSQIDQIIEDFDSQEIVIGISNWLGNKKGLKEFTEYVEEEIDKFNEF